MSQPPFSRRAVIASALVMGMPAFAQSRNAQQFPSRPITLVVPASPGGPIDILGRVLGKVIQDQTSNPVVIENRAGATGSIGVNSVVRAQPDGYTLVIAGLDAVVVYPQVKMRPPYHVDEDLTAIAMVASTSLVYLVNTRCPANEPREFAALARTKKMSYASSGTAGAIQLAVELLNHKLGIELLHVPYKGGAPALMSVASGETDLTAASPMGAKQLLDSGQLKALAITAQSRSPLLPRVPTLAEIGYPDLTIPIWYGVFAPAEIPGPVAERLAAIFLAAVRSAEFERQARTLGLDVDPLVGARFGKMLQAESARWKKVIEQSQIKLDE